MRDIETTKYRKLKKDVDYSIPCRREDGTEDEITIRVSYDEQYKTDIVFLNNRFMGAYPQKIREDALWFKIA